MLKRRTNFIAKVGMLSAAAFLLQMLGSFMGLKIGGFLEIEFSDLPAIIGTLSLGPLAGVTIELVKNILHSFMTSTGFVGELANFIVNGVFVLVVGIIYKYNKTKKGAIIALSVGVILMTISAIFTNLYIMLPLYMASAPFNDKLNLVITLITPFNFVRGSALAVITMLIYKKISPLLK